MRDVGYKMFSFNRRVPERMRGNGAKRSQTCGGLSQRSCTSDACLSLLLCRAFVSRLFLVESSSFLLTVNAFTIARTLTHTDTQMRRLWRNMTVS